MRPDAECKLTGARRKPVPRTGTAPAWSKGVSPDRGRGLEVKRCAHKGGGDKPPPLPQLVRSRCVRHMPRPHAREFRIIPFRPETVCCRSFRLYCALLR